MPEKKKELNYEAAMKQLESILMELRTIKIMMTLFRMEESLLK